MRKSGQNLRKSQLKSGSKNAEPPKKGLLNRMPTLPLSEFVENAAE